MAAAVRLTTRRLLLSVGVSAAVAIAAVLICPLVGVELRPGGHALALLDVGAIWRGARGAHTEAWRIYELARLPRALAGAIVGAGLAAAGATFQAVLRNPLAEPYTLGISSGSALCAVIAIRLGLDHSALGYSAVSAAALLGAGVTVYLVWRLGRVGASLPPATLLLAGVTVAMFCAAASMFILYTSDFSQVYRIVGWMMGGLDYTLYGPLVRAAVPIAIGLAVLAAVARDLNALSAGADAAASVGVNAARSLTLAFVTSSLVVGASISLAGPVGFVGLIVPHATRAVVGPDHRVLLPTSMCSGAAFLVICDTVGRIVIPGQELPVGIVTALLGGPFFLYLLVGEKRKGRLWGG